MGTARCFLLSYSAIVVAERFIACRCRIQGNMVFPASEEHYMFAVQVKGRYIIADGLYGTRRGFLDWLPHFFKDGLGIHRKSTDVFVDSRELLVICHLFFSLRLAYSASQCERAFVRYNASLDQYSMLRRKNFLDLTLLSEQMHPRDAQRDGLDPRREVAKLVCPAWISFCCGMLSLSAPSGF